MSTANVRAILDLASDNREVKQRLASLERAIGKGGALAWGAIGGTLSDQTDLQAALNNRVLRAGDTMSGQLAIVTGGTALDVTGSGPGLVVRRSGAQENNPFIGFFNASDERIGIVHANDDASEFRLVSDNGRSIHMYAGSDPLRGVKVAHGTGNITFGDPDSTTLRALWNASSGGLVLRTTSPGGLTLNATSSGSNGPLVQFRHQGNDAVISQIRARGDALLMESMGGRPIVFWINGNDIARYLSTGNYLLGKIAPGLATVGFEQFSDGTQYITRGSVGNTLGNLYLNRVGTANASGALFAVFLSAGSVAGSITRGASAGTVVYNTSSDARLKKDAGPFDDMAAMASLRALKPRRFTWIDDPEAGEQIGLFAQEAIEVAPEAVTVGCGEPSDGDLDPDHDGQGFMPWSIDYGRLTPRLIAAYQALDRENVSLRAENDTLTARLDALEARMAAVERSTAYLDDQKET